jgi:GNAT superfamily N-acetyltransferase
MPVTVRPVTSQEDLQAFIDFPYRLHRDETRWIPAPPEARAQVLDRDQNPYFEHADAEYFLAEREGKEVGQVIAHVDHALNEYQGNDWGLFGFFESEDDQEVANALLGESARWLAERGRGTMVGPFSFSAKEDPGFLVEGYEHRPVIFQPWHPPHYRRLMEGAGLSKSVDVLWRELDLMQVPEALRTQLARLTARIEDRHGVSVRGLREDDIHAELERVYRFFPPIFKDHWGYVPLTDRELIGGLEFATQIMGPGTLVVERDGELIGASMIVPDFYQRLTHENGEVTYTPERKIDQTRFMFMAVLPQYRHLGVTAALCHRHLEMAKRDRIEHVVIGWSVEDNEEMNIAVARLGLEVSRRHRVYEKELSPSSASG